MAAFDLATLDRWRALAIVDRDGTTVGTVSEFYLDRETGYPTWALVETGLFGPTLIFVPLVHATEISDGLQVPYEKRHIKDSPRVDIHDELTPDEEAALFAHYGVDYEPSTEVPTGVEDEAGSAESVPPEPGSAGSLAAVDGGPGSGEPPGPVAVDPGSAGWPAAVDEAPQPGEAPGPVPPESGSAGRRHRGGAGRPRTGRGRRRPVRS
jgi:PRC-barrel domain